MAHKKKTKAEVKYQWTPKGAQRCGNCSMFVPGQPHSCTDVAGIIAADGWCNIWAGKKKK